MDKFIDKINDYILSGQKQSQSLGIEIEHFILDKNDKSVFYSYDNDKPGIREILNELSIFYDKKIYENFDKKKHLIGLKRKDAEISIEPGAQFEVSFSPLQNVKQFEKSYLNFVNETKQILKKYDYHLANIGYRPDACALEVPLIPKMRYIAMDANFKTVDTQGFCMMRNSAATQITIDFENEKDCIKKIKTATLLCPLFYFLFDNSPIFERSKVGKEQISVSELNVPKRMARWQIWNNTDNDRCTCFPNIFNDNFSIIDYAKTINNLPKIYYPEKFKNEKDKIKHELSMAFFDVRLKDTIEIRCADSIPFEYLLAYTSIIKSLFYNKNAFSKLNKLFLNINYEDYISAGINLYNEGWNAIVYHKPIDTLLKNILDIANDINSKYLAPLYELIENKHCVFESQNYKFKSNNDVFKPISKTYENTQYQVNKFLNNDWSNDRKQFFGNHKYSKATYNNKVACCNYFIKAFDLSSQLELQFITNKINTILNKVIDHYNNDAEFKKLFKFDKWSQKLIDFKPKYSQNIPIARYDIFLDDSTGNFKFCEFNTGGSAAMSKAQFIAEEMLNTQPYKSLSKRIKKENKKLKTWELFDSYVKQYLKIYDEWAHNINKSSKKINVAIVDFLDNCQLEDFKPFRQSFIKAGCNCEICDVRDLKFDGNLLYTNNNYKIDTIYKRVTLNDLINFKEHKGTKALINAVLKNKVCPIDWFNNQPVHDKQICYILRNPITHKFLSPSEISFIKNKIPATYKLTKDFDNIKEIINNKNDFILKPLNSRDSIGIYSGRDLNQKQWEEKIQKCCEANNYIVQEFCKIYTSDSIHIDVYDEKASLNDPIKQYSNMYGLYCYNNKFSGIYLRQGDHSKNSIEFDDTCTCFYETDWK